jgi:hypothetical protein
MQKKLWIAEQVSPEWLGGYFPGLQQESDMKKISGYDGG